MRGHGEMPLRRTRLQQIADLDLFVQVRRHTSITFDADAEKIVRRCARQAVRADMHLAINVEPQRQMLPGVEQWQPGTVGGFQIDRANVVAFRFNPHHPQRPPAIAQGLRLQTSLGLRPSAGQQTGGRDAVETPAQRQSSRPTHHMFHVERP